MPLACRDSAEASRRRRNAAEKGAEPCRGSCSTRNSTGGRAFSRTNLTLFLLAVILAVTAASPDGWWSPWTWTPASVLVTALLVIAWFAARADLRAGAGVLMAGMAVAAVLSPPSFHLWGDGALRLRNLEQGIAVMTAAPFEPGGYLLQRLLVSAGLTPEGSFRAAGPAGGALYLLGSLLVARRAIGRECRASVLVLAASPTLTVFFTGYVESYALPAGLACLCIALLSEERHSRWSLPCALAASLAHAGFSALLPGAALQEWKEKRKASAAAAAVLSLSIPALLLAARGAPGALHRVGIPDPVERLHLVVFTAPVIAAMAPLAKKRPSTQMLIPASTFLLAFLLFPLERGEAIDWDLGALLLLPVCVVVLDSARDAGSRLLVPLALAAAVAAGPRTGSFLDAGTSEARYMLAADGATDPAVFEELGILERERGRFDLAAGFFERAFELSGNGRHLAQVAESARLSGRLDLALETARRAASERPDVETVWLQYALAARDAGSTADAMEAAGRHEDLFGPRSPLWAYALETALACGDTASALRAAAAALESMPGDPSVLVNSAWACLLSGDSAGAEALLERAALAAPFDPLPHYDLAVMAAGSGDSVSALSHIREALTRDPDMHEALVLRESLTGPPR
ncbi:hypothetical protein GX411_11415 [Candidatus Fermentibacteria bacterium]|nr:hypothetical protein [Candidatus Fermentibacteria bacterium]